jgi:6-phosphofructokinase 2
MEAGVYLIKPNIGELSAFAGKDFLSIDDARAIAMEIVASGKCEVVVVSMGSAGAMLVTKDLIEIYTSPKVERKSTVGAGDSMVAGIIYSLSCHKELTDAVRYGVACGTAATMNPGTELCRKEDAEALFEGL